MPIEGEFVRPPSALVSLSVSSAALELKYLLFTLIGNTLTTSSPKRSVLLKQTKRASGSDHILLVIQQILGNLES